MLTASGRRRVFALRQSIVPLVKVAVGIDSGYGSK